MVPTRSFPRCSIFLMVAACIEESAVAVDSEESSLEGQAVSVPQKANAAMVTNMTVNNRFLRFF